MHEFPKKIGINVFLSIILIFTLLTDFSIHFDILFLRQIFVFLFLTLIPGILLIVILNINIGFTEKFILSVGLSVSFWMLYGLLINNILLAWGYETPLSKNSLLIALNFSILLLIIIAKKMNKNIMFSFQIFHLSTLEKSFLIIPLLFPTISFVGMYFINIIGNNQIIIFLLLLIPTYVVFICFCNNIFPKKLYSVSLFLISLSLLMIAPLRSNHILGMDTHSEYYIFQIVLKNLHWEIFERTTVNSCLSVSLLPAIYQILLDINPELVFKCLYSLIFSISSLVVFFISRKYLDDLYAFLASFFFMSQLLFLWTEANARTNLAILYCALFIMVLFQKDISKVNKKVLCIIFLLSCIFSHYSTTYILLFLILATFFWRHIILVVLVIYKNRNLNFDKIKSLIKNYNVKNNLSLTMLILFFSMIFFWYGLVSPVTFGRGVTCIYRILLSFNDFFLLESRGSTTSQAVGVGVSEITQRIKFIVYWLSIIYIFIGLLTTIIKSKEIVSFSDLKIYNKSEYLISKIDLDYFLYSLASFLIIVLSAVIPHILIEYNLVRLYFMAMTVLAPYFIIGGITVSQLLKNIRHKELFVIFLILIPTFICTSSVVDELFNKPKSILFNSQGSEFNYSYVYDQETVSAEWLHNKANFGTDLIYSDFTGDRRLISQGMISYQFIDKKYLLLQNETNISGYIYLRNWNVFYNKLLDEHYQEHELTEFKNNFAIKSRIYDNGGSEIWR